MLIALYLFWNVFGGYNKSVAWDSEEKNHLPSLQA